MLRVDKKQLYSQHHDDTARRLGTLSNPDHTGDALLYTCVRSPNYAPVLPVG